ncbi:MAG TPA: glycosyltransferase family 39 protein [Thermoleophilaceae bacterium]|nr:glycosyltransferase family 39 protein [Thermoleophilaceae bacterium]
MTTRGFLLRLAPLLVLALGLRLAYSLLLVKTQPLLGDGLEFHNLAYSIADSHRYAQASFLTPARVLPTADKPPLYPFVLALFTLVGGHGWIPHQIAGALIGTGTVAVTAFLGRRVAGDVVGLIAGGVAAIYPMLIAADGSFRSESLYALLITATLLSAYALWDRPTVRRALVCGALIGLATLTRSEALALLVLLVLPAALLAVPRRRAAGLTLAAAMAAFVVLAPWLIRCWVQFDRPVFVSTNSGGLLAGANCDKTYHGEWLGQWRFDCLRPVHGANEAVVSSKLASDGIDYARDHSGRVPVVLGVRVLRSWELYRPRQQWTIERFFEGRDLRVEQIGVVMYFVLVLLGIAGALRLRSRGQPLRILLAPFVLVTLVSLGAYGFTRFRVAAEPALVVLASVTLAAAAARLRRGRRAARQTQAP